MTCKIQSQNNQQQNANIIKYCYKCLSKLVDGDRNIVRDHNGNLYCDAECRRNNYTEVNQDRDDMNWRNHYD